MWALLVIQQAVGLLITAILTAIYMHLCVCNSHTLFSRC